VYTWLSGAQCPVSRPKTMISWAPSHASRLNTITVWSPSHVSRLYNITVWSPQGTCHGHTPWLTEALSHVSRVYTRTVWSLKSRVTCVHQDSCLQAKRGGGFWWLIFLGQHGSSPQRYTTSPGGEETTRHIAKLRNLYSTINNKQYMLYIQQVGSYTIMLVKENKQWWR
jgi:hypothetical protein